MLGNYRVTSQLVASEVVLISIELVSECVHALVHACVYLCTVGSRY
jgi:hypothetical protein